MPKVKRTEEERRAREGIEFIESLDRGLRVLQSFATDRRPMTLSDLAKVSNLPRATTRRILMTLQKAGFVSGDERLFAIVLAATAELPTAALCLMVARHVEEAAERAQRYALIARRLRVHRRQDAEAPAEAG